MWQPLTIGGARLGHKSTGSAQYQYATRGSVRGTATLIMPVNKQRTYANICKAHRSRRSAEALPRDVIEKSAICVTKPSVSGCRSVARSMKVLTLLVTCKSQIIKNPSAASPRMRVSREGPCCC